MSFTSKSKICVINTFMVTNNVIMITHIIVFKARQSGLLSRVLLTERRSLKKILFFRFFRLLKRQRNKSSKNIFTIDGKLINY